MNRDPAIYDPPSRASAGPGDADALRIFTVTRLMHSVQLLAQPAEVQDASLPDFVCKADELALDFDHWRRCVESDRAATLSAEQREALRVLDARIDDVFLHDVPDDERQSLTRPAWGLVREAARAALAAFGWPADRPPSYAHEFIGGPPR